MVVHKLWRRGVPFCKILGWRCGSEERATCARSLLACCLRSLRLDRKAPCRCWCRHELQWAEDLRWEDVDIADKARIREDLAKQSARDTEDRQSTRHRYQTPVDQQTDACCVLLCIDQRYARKDNRSSMCHLVMRNRAILPACRRASYTTAIT